MAALGLQGCQNGRGNAPVSLAVAPAQATGWWQEAGTRWESLRGQWKLSQGRLGKLGKPRAVGGKGHRPCRDSP